MLVAVYNATDNFINETYYKALPHYAEAMGFDVTVIAGDGQNDTDLYISYGSKECRNHNEFIRYTEDIFTIQRKMVNKARIYLHLFKGHDHSEASWAKETNVWVKELGFNKIR